MMSANFNGKDFTEQSKMGNPVEQNDSTSVALLEQLIYVDSFMPETDPAAFDSQLTTELAAFADDSFIFPDEGKPMNGNPDDEDEVNHPIQNGNSDNNLVNGNEALNWNQSSGFMLNDNSFFNGRKRKASDTGKQESGAQINSDLLSQSLVTILSSQKSSQNTVIDSLSASLLSSVPKVQVPPGAMSKLSDAGLSQIQIDALAALIAQHQSKAGGRNEEPSQSQNLAQHHQEQVSQNHQPAMNENTIFNNSAVTALNLLTNNMNMLNNFTPIPEDNNNNTTSSNHNAQLLSLVSVLNDNGPEPEHIADEHGASTSVRSANTASSSRTSSGIKVEPNDSHIPGNGEPSESAILLAGNEPSDSAMSSANESRDPTTGRTEVADDKRRRNTAASARFRVKKKLKEQEMQRSIRELNENAERLQLRIQQLETENRVLKNLVIEKGAQRNNDELERLKKRAKESI